MDLERASASHQRAVLADNRKAETAEQYGRVARRFCLYLREHGERATAESLTTNHVRDFVLWLKTDFWYVDQLTKVKRRLGPRGIRDHVQALKALSSYLWQSDFVDRDPLAGLRMPKIPKLNIQTFDKPQLILLLNQANRGRTGIRDAALFLMLLDTGMRVSELCGLTLGYLDLDYSPEKARVKVVWQTAKGLKERYVYMWAGTAKEVERYLLNGRPDSREREDYAFLTQDGLQMSRHTIGDMMGRWGERAGIRGMRVSPHILRHTFAVNYLRANRGDLFGLQELLGHADLETVRIYARLAEQDVADTYVSGSPVRNLGLVDPRGRMRKAR